MDPHPLAGRVALVTGASRGIGAATAHALDAAGAKLALVARTADAIAPVREALGHRALVVGTDLAAPDAPAEVARAVLDEYGRIDVVVNNAAVAARLDTVDTNSSLVDHLFAVNVRAPLLLIAALIPHMIERRAGSIINLSSISSLVGTPRRAAYAASKGAVDAMTRSLAVELGPHGIRVNAVAPGVVDTELWEKNKAIPGVIEAIEGLTPLRRWATPADIADVIVFLASDAARFITGEIVATDGGMARTLDLYGGAV